MTRAEPLDEPREKVKTSWRHLCTLQSSDGAIEPPQAPSVAQILGTRPRTKPALIQAEDGHRSISTSVELPRAPA